MDKKVLIITYYWPPSGGGGVQRWLKFAKYLPDYGWEPIIFTPENPDFDLKDQSLNKDVNDDLEVLKFPIWEPYQLFKRISGKKELKQGQVLEEGKKSLLSKIAIWIRGNLFIPDPRKFWIKPSVEYLNTIIEGNGIKTIVTTGPPHSMHLIGLRLKEKNPDLNWVADFRDPWSKWDILDKFQLSRRSEKKHQNLESQVFKAASRIITVSDSWKKEFEQIGARRVDVITNGFDSSDIIIRDSTEKNKFRICHAGMLNDFRNPTVLWQALRELIHEEQGFKSDLEISLIGILSQQVNQMLMNDVDLKDLLVLSEYLPHDKVFNAYAQSAVLLLILNDSKNAKGHLPGKLFEYMAVKTPVLGIGEEDGDASYILSSTNSGKVISPLDKDGLKQQLLFLYRNWKNNEPIAQEGIDKFDRRILTSKLATLLDQL